MEIVCFSELSCFCLKRSNQSFFYMHLYCSNIRTKNTHRLWGNGWGSSSLERGGTQGVHQLQLGPVHRRGDGRDGAGVAPGRRLAAARVLRPGGGGSPPRAIRPVKAVMASHRGPADVSGEDEAAASRQLGSWWSLQ